MLTSIKVSFTTVAGRIRRQLPILSVLPLTVLAAGCIAPGSGNLPPSAATIFNNPAANTVFPTTSAFIGLNHSAVNYTTVCYTVDGTSPSYAGASCTGGTTATYLGDIELSCGSEETGVVQKSVRIAYLWDGAAQLSRADYSLTCSVPSNVTVFNLSGIGEISGGAPGTLTLTGFAQLDRDTGILSFRSSNTSITGFTNVTTTDEGSISGQWAKPSLSTLEGLATTTHCFNNGGLVNGCDYVALDSEGNMGITQESDPITFDLSAGGSTVFSGSVTRVPPEVPVAVTTIITYTLTALDTGEELPTFSVGGNVNGLSAGTLVLELNERELLSVASDGTGTGSFTFSSPLNDSALYSVTVNTDPTGLRCDINNGMGTIAVADVNNISITCSDPAIADLVFPDENLASCVSAAALGLTHMSELTELNCSGREILTAEGIDQLTALTSLNLSNNLLTSTATTTTIDVSNLANLSVLNLSINHLTRIDLSNNSALTSVNVSDNWLTQIDTSSIAGLVTLLVNINPLTSIDLQSNPALKTLIMGFNPSLTSIDLSYNPALHILGLWNLDISSVDLASNANLSLMLLSNLPNLDSIDLTYNPALTYIQINNTLISSIDIENNVAAKTIHLSNNQLDAIDLGTNTALTSLNLINNQLLTIDLDSNALLETANLTGNSFDAATVSYLEGLTITNLTY